MKNYLERFIDQGLIYRSNRYDFLLLKDLIVLAREEQLDVKIRDLKELLITAGWTEKKAAISTTEGYQSKDIWIAPMRYEKIRNVPIQAVARKNLAEAEEAEAKRLVSKIFTEIKNMPEVPAGVFLQGNELVFTNKGLKLLLEMLQANGSIPKLSSIIRGWSSKLLVGEHFFGTSSRTVLFKNYYKLRG